MLHWKYRILNSLLWYTLITVHLRIRLVRFRLRTWHLGQRTLPFLLLILELQCLKCVLLISRFLRLLPITMFWLIPDCISVRLSQLIEVPWHRPWDLLSVLLSGNLLMLERQFLANRIQKSSQFFTIWQQYQPVQTQPNSSQVSPNQELYTLQLWKLVQIETKSYRQAYSLNQWKQESVMDHKEHQSRVQYQPFNQLWHH